MARPAEFLLDSSSKQSVPGADRGPRAGSPRGVVVATGSREVSTESGSDQVQRTHDRGSRSRNPVAIAPGTDSVAGAN